MSRGVVDRIRLVGNKLDGIILFGAEVDRIELVRSSGVGDIFDRLILDGIILDGITLDGIRLDGITLDGILLDI
mgnify:CR=1 FL=1